jgi:hypothetical protein
MSGVVIAVVVHSSHVMWFFRLLTVRATIILQSSTGTTWNMKAMELPLVDNDFMLLFLRDSAPENAAFVKLNDNPVVPSNGVNVTVIGHGLTDPNGIDISEDLLEVDVNIVSNQKCSQSEGYYEYWSWWGETIQEFGLLDGMITDNMLCAMDHGEDACQGKLLACLHFMFQMQYFFFC